MRRLFDDRVRMIHDGTAFGDASTRSSDARERIARRASTLRLSGVTLLRVDFTDIIVDLAYREGVETSTETADGCVLARQGHGVAIANADCAIGVLAGRDACVVLHLGLACLVRADGLPGVLERAIEKLGEPAEQKLWIGAAIGPCCHGYDDSRPEHARRARELVERFGAAAIPGAVLWGPRRGQVAHDHAYIAEAIARSRGVGHIERDSLCTSCHGLVDPNASGYGTWYSNVRDHSGDRMRNLAMVWLPR